MTEAVDGEYQTFKSRDGAYVREHFFGAVPGAQGAGRPHDRRGDLGPEPRRPRPAQGLRGLPRRREPRRASRRSSSPRRSRATGWARAGEGQNITHQAKKMKDEALLVFRDRFNVPLSDDEARKAAVFYTPPGRQPGDDLPARAPGAPRRQPPGAGGRSRRSMEVPPLVGLRGAARGHAAAGPSRPRWPSCAPSGRWCATRSIGPHVVPIVADESRTFGMEGMFRQLGIFSQVGQLYEPRGLRAAHVLPGGHEGARSSQEGITEAGATVLLDRRRHLLREQRRPDDPLLHLLLDVRLPAGRRPDLGRRRLPGARVPRSAAPRGAPPSTARACSTRTATATWWRRRSRTAAPTTRPTPTRWP